MVNNVYAYMQITCCILQYCSSVSHTSACINIIFQCLKPYPDNPAISAKLLKLAACNTSEIILDELLRLLSISTHKPCTCNLYTKVSVLMCGHSPPLKLAGPGKMNTFKNSNRVIYSTTASGLH